MATKKVPVPALNKQAKAKMKSADPAEPDADDPIPTSKTNKATKGAVAKKAGGSKK